MESEERRFISKKFRCSLCMRSFRKLVKSSEKWGKCPECGHEHCAESVQTEFNREEVDRVYRLAFDRNDPRSNEYHSTTDIYDNSLRNIYGDSRRLQPQIQSQQFQSQSQQQFQSQQQQQQNNRIRNHLHSVFIPFSVSPFAGSVSRAPFDFDIFMSPFNDGFFEMPTHDFFMDNFASNFTSSFSNPMARIIFIQTMQNNQPQGNPPVSKVSLDKLKKFKMTQDHCKKDGDKLEYPTCSICLMDVAQDQDGILVPCGHIFHESCIMQWFNLHNSCPVCRFELPTDNEQYERERNQRNLNRNINMARNTNMTTVQLNNSNISSTSQQEQQPNRNEGISNSNNNNSNINLQGESNGLL